MDNKKKKFFNFGMLSFKRRDSFNVNVNNVLISLLSELRLPAPELDGRGDFLNSAFGTRFAKTFGIDNYQRHVELGSIHIYLDAYEDLIKHLVEKKLLETEYSDKNLLTNDGFKSVNYY